MRPSRSHFPLFVAWVVAAAALLAGLGLTAWNLPLLRARADLRALLRPHRVAITLGMLLDEKGASPAEREQIRNAYAHPDRIDLHRISWNLRSRPTPFVGGAPQPGPQAEGPINREQLRDEREVVIPKPAGVFRIFITGGSLAYSAGLPDHTLSIARLLQERLNREHAAADRRFEVWNSAVPSWASTHERIWISNRLVPLDPDLIIMLTGTNECHWGYGGLNVLDLRTYTEEEYFALVNIARRVGGVAPYPSDPPYDVPKPIPVATVAERFAMNVRLAAAALAPRRVPLLVALQPYLSPAAKRLTPVERQWTLDPENAPKVAYMGECFDAMQKAVQRLIAASDPQAYNPANLRLVSLRDVFAGRADPIFIDLFHVVDKGNALIAERLERELFASGLIRSSSPPVAVPAPTNP
jgi:lysophospholipase L1-like esterase